jgi:hypothetical protein
MADLTAKHGKGTPKVDLTPMVDLGFLLITFFMFTTTMSDKKAMAIQMPFKPETTEAFPPTVVKASTAMTVLLGADHKLYYYLGGTAVGKPQILSADFGEGAGSISAAIVQKQREVQAFIASGKLQSDDKFTLIIKPCSESTTEDFVRILDEININKVAVYSIVDVSEQEMEWIRAFKSI